MRKVILGAYVLAVAHAAWTALWRHTDLFFADQVLLTFAAIDALYHVLRHHQTP